MSNRRKIRAGRRSTPPAAGHGLDCGCEHYGVMHAYGRCPDCGAPSERTFPPMPTNGEVGDTRRVGWSCACGGEVDGYAEIVSVVA